MKTISIRALHTRTGHFVREASDEPLGITERGRVIAVLRPWEHCLSTQNPFPDRSLKDLVPVKKGSPHSTEMISEDRDRA